LKGENMDAQLQLNSGAEFGTELAREIRDYVRRAVAPLEKRIVV
jgi:hypothetical protein